MTSTPTISPTLSKTRRFVVWCTLVAFVAQPMIVTAQVVADPNAGKYRPTVEAAPNGVPLVQITAPTAGGVSRNQYTNYSVEQRGVVLNNSNVVVQSQLAGWIVGNPNLTNGTARIILNEVTSTNPSDLRGYTEVAGSKADVIIANPNGITCNGCGFINTSRGVLTTGTPVFGGDGSLSAFRVTGGNIAITGTGMVGTGADQIDLIARAVQVNAELWAKTLNVITGANQVDYATLATQTIAGSGAAPAVSIDVAALGGMYANKIRLVGTEAGVGVANAGNLVSAGDISITSAGRIVNTGTIGASGNTDFAATGLTNSGSIDSRQNMNIATSGDIQNAGLLTAGNNLQASAASLDSTGTLAAGVRDDGTLGTSGNLSMTTTGALVATGTNAAGGDLALQGASLDLRGADNSAGSDLTLTASTGNIDHRGARTSAGGRATLTAAADIDNRSSGSISARDITLAASGALVNEGSTIEAGNTLAVTAASINNRSGRLANTGNGASTVSASGAIDNTAGLIGGNGAVTLSAASIDNSSGELTAAGRLEATTTGNLTNAAGKMTAGTSLDVVAGARLDNTDGRIEAETTAAIKADTLDNTRGRIANAGTGTTSVEGTTRIINASGLIGGNGDLDIRGGAVENAAGALVAGNDLGLTVTTVANNGGQIEATRDLKLAADALTGAGSVLAGRDLDARFSGDFTHDAGATMQANRNLALSAVGAITNSGEILAVGDLAVSAASLDNRGSGTLNADTTTVTATGSIANAGWISGNTVTTTSDSLTNTGTVIGDNVTINANNLTNRGASAGIYAATALDLLIANAVANLDGAVIYSQGDLNIGASTRRDVDGYLADASASFTNSSGIVQAEGALRISATQITNKRSTLDIQWTAERTGAYTDSGANHYTSYYSNEYVGSGTTAEGKLLSGTNTWLKGNILLNEYSVIAAGGDLNYNVGSVTNTGRALMEKKSDRGYTDNWQWVVVGSHRCGFLGLRRCDDWGWRNYTYAYNQETTYQIGSVDAVMTAGQRVAGVSNTLTNQTVTSIAVGATLGANGTTNVSSATGAYTPTLPTSGFYRYHAEPNQRYLIETDPRFASFKNFISSDYMLSRLPFDPQGTQKRLGDGAYEQKLITEQIVQQTGRRFLAGYASAETEFQALMESGLAAAETFKLKPGIALTGEQVAALTHDMVWMVEQDVTLPNGKHDRVLVPVVYLTRAHSEDLKPNGALIAANDLQLQINGTLANSGTLKGSNRLQLAATDVANRGGRIQSAGDLRIDAANDLNNQSGSIAGRRVAIVAGRDLKSERLTEALQLAAVSTTRIRSDAAISASESLDVSAGRDLTLIAARTESGGDTRLQAGRNLSIGTVAASESVANGNGGKSRQTQLGSQLNSGGNLTLIAANDATLTTAELNATQNIALAAGGNVTLAASKDSRQSSFSGRGTRNRQLDETARGSQMNAGGQITVLATDFNKLVEAAPTAAGAPAMAAAPAGTTGNISLEAASLNSKSGSVTVAADGNLTVKEATERHEAMSETRKSSRGFFSSKTTTTRSESSSEIAVGSTISGESVRMESGRDMAVRGSNVVATNDTTLIAGSKLSVEAAHETHNESHFTETKQSGLFSSGGIGFTLGSKQQSTDQKSEASTAGKSTIGSTDGNVTLIAGEKYRQQGSDVIAAKGNIEITAKSVDILEARETSKTTTETKFSQSGLTLAITSPVITAVQTAQQMSQAAKDTKDGRMKMLAAANVGLAANNAIDAIKTGQGTTTPDGKTNQVPVVDDKGQVIDTRDANAADQAGGINISISLGASKSSSTSTQTSDTAATSNLTAGRDINITATGAGKDSDLTIQGSKAAATRDITLAADDEIRLLAARNTADQKSSNKNSSASVGIGFSLGGQQNGFTIQAGVSGGRGSADGKDVGYTNTHVEAGNTLTVQSGGDTTLKGAVASGKQVIADVGGNLAIESLQDTSTYNSQQKSAGVSISVCVPPFCYGAASSGSVSASQSKIDSNYASVAEQSALRAGDGGFQVNAQGNTDLKGGAITSTQAAIDKNLNSFQTGGTLTTSDIQNQASYSAKSVSVNVGTGFSPSGSLTPGGTSVGFGKDGGNASSTTQAAISGIAGNKDARTGDKEAGIQKIFDQQKVQKEIAAQTQITQMFGQMAPKAAAEFAKTQADNLRKQGNEEEAKKWDEGGAYRIALHAAVGGLAGGTSGALGAGTTAATAPLLNELQENIAKNLKEAGVNESVAKVAGQLISGATAAGIGSLASGGSTAGAAMGLNVDANNRQLHPDQVALVRQKAKQLDGVDGKSAGQWEKELTQQLLKQNDFAYADFTENLQARAILKELSSSSGVSMSAEGTDAYRNHAINAEYLTRLQGSYRLAGLPSNVSSVDPVIKALKDATLIQDFKSQNKETQRAIYDQLIDAYRQLPTSAQATRLLATNQIDNETYAAIERSRGAIESALYNGGPMFKAAGILNPEELQRLNLSNLASAYGAGTNLVAGVLAGRSLGANSVVGAKGGAVIEEAAAGPVNFMGSNDQFFKNAAKRGDIDANGTFDVVAHGSTQKIEVMTPNGSVVVDQRVAAKLIENSPGYNGQPIRLLSCDTGACDTGFAQNLANKMGVPVQAPTNLVWAYGDGRMVVAPRSSLDPNSRLYNVPDLSRQGSFKTFVPGKSQ